MAIRSDLGVDTPTFRGGMTQVHTARLERAEAGEVRSEPLVCTDPRAAQ